MHAVQMIGHGGYEMLQYSETVAIPSPKPDQVLIRVKAAGVNNTDINTRIGWYSKGDNQAEDASWSGEALKLPRVQGADICGEIVAVGGKIDANRIGQRVLVEPCLSQVEGSRPKIPWYIGSECDGGFAQYAVVDSVHAYHINSSLSDVELASFPCSYSTAENMLTRARVSQDDRVLISGASGGVGSAAIQLAKARGAYVIAITSPSKSDHVKALGADQTVSRTDLLPEVLGHNSIDVVIDLVAGDAWPQFLDVLRHKGRYAVSGAIGGAMVNLDVRTLYLKDLSFFGCTVLEPEVFQNLVNRIESNHIKPIVARTFALKEIQAAQEFFLAKSHVGKVVLTVE
ncbi:alcohol dehydrogenase family protein [Vibrio sp. SCSIO 43135]|uniref:alcohol dehydrogenase family protein n=1 Tax=Vibrio sp. SCSIO 43135 TaxID=2819096 RepID=UPI002074FAF1|nr:alcohol dehydrogenase family protein [Vibrio sp. SCSIO 43135]USD44202.1 alcohol dehydrogenase family protein [Vibrio sp. SCSIO 43135]